VSNAAGVVGTPTGLFYADVAEDSPFYLWIMRLTDLGVMSGYPCGGKNEPWDDQQRPYFRPFNNVTRGQASKIVANTFLPNCVTLFRRENGLPCSKHSQKGSRKKEPPRGLLLLCTHVSRVTLYCLLRLSAIQLA